MEFGPFLFFAFLIFLFNLLKGSGKRIPRPPEPPDRSERPLPPVTGTDATQAEGGRLEGLLRDLGRTLEDTARARTVPPPVEAARVGEEEPEERGSLEVVPEVVSLEREERRPDRAVVDQDDGAEQVVSRRIAAAQARNVSHRPVDHREFDRKIRQEPADHTAVRTYTAKQLRDAVVWREILGPPAALRDDPRAAERPPGTP